MGSDSGYVFACAWIRPRSGTAPGPQTSIRKARPRLHLEGAAEEARTLVHPQQSQLAPVGQLAQATGEPEPASVVLNDHPHPVAVAAQGETGPGGPGGSADGVQGLLGDAEQGQLG